MSALRASVLSARPVVSARPVRKVATAKAVLKTLPVKPAKTSPKTATKQVSTPVKKSSSSGGFKLGFTKSNELFVGRLAMLGFASSLIGEVITGQGALAQLGYETGLSLGQVDEVILGLIAFNLVAAILPTSQTFVPEEQASLETRPKGPLQDPTISLLEPKKFFGVSGFGFTKENELFVGRMAQLGFAASLLGEALTGKGPLAQFDFETGIPLQETEFGLIAFILFFLLAAINPGSGKFVDDSDEVY